ncbi:MAG TPA: flagellar motor protein MotD [Pseudomonadales bacterium]
MLRRSYLEDSDNHERWLVSYADFITLLFAFFVVMYAISTVNESKYRVLSATLMETFAAPAASPIDPIPIGEPALAASPHVVDVPDTMGFRDEEEGDTHIEPSRARVEERLAGFLTEGVAAVEANNDWLEISLDASALFASGSAELSESAIVLLTETAAFLREFDNPVTVEGYTDNTPIGSARFPSNWELSAARASRVVRFFEAQGVARERLSAVGYGENHALETNATPEGRARNRRVVVVVARKGNLPRNLNAAGADSAFAYVRRQQPAGLDGSVKQVRTESGGLLFTNEAPAPES